MRIEYQNQNYKEIIDEQFITKKFDTFAFKNSLKSFARSCQLSDQLFPSYVQDTIKHLDNILESVLCKMPFNNTSPEYQHIKISILLCCLNSLKEHRKLMVDNRQIML
jgi:hypothetical protein